MNTPAESLVGRQLGAYRITTWIGAGGMGEVYRARDTRLLEQPDSDVIHVMIKR